MKKRFALMAATLMTLQIFAGGGYSPSLAEEPEKSIWPDQPVVEEHSIWPDQPEDPEAEAPAEEAMPEQEREDNMATKGMAVFRSNGEDYTVNDPNIANEFSALTSYAAGTYVNYQGNLYKFTTDHAAGSWNSAHVSQVLLGQDVSDLKSAFNSGDIFNRNIKNGYFDPVTFEFTSHNNTHTSVLDVRNASRVRVSGIVTGGYNIDIFFSNDGSMAKGQHWAFNNFTDFEVFVPNEATKCYIQFAVSQQTALSAYITLKAKEAEYVANDYAKYVSGDYESIPESGIVIENAKWDLTNKKLVANAGLRTIIMPVKSGEKFAVFSNTWRTNYKAYTFISDDFTALEYGDATFIYNGWVVTTPANATLLIISGDSVNYNINVRKITGEEVACYTKCYIYDKYFSRTQTIQYQSASGYMIILASIGNAEKAMISANRYLTTYYGYTFYNASLEIVGGQSETGRIENEIVDIPQTATYLVVTGDTALGAVRCDLGTQAELEQLKKEYELTIDEDEINDIIKKQNKWYGKKIVWFGTSIPAGKVNGKSYPELVASKLGATIYNEAIPSSMIRTGVADCPLICKALSLSATHTEKEAEDWYSSLSDADKTRAYNSSRDIVFDKYLSTGSVGSCDLYVFDHGYNDTIPSDHEDLLIEPQNEFDRQYFYGAANYLINRILVDNPRAKIVWIGHYENQLDNEGAKQNRGATVSVAQKHVADKWGIPLCELWNYLGWSGQQITTTGYWSNGIWVNSGGTETQMYIKDCQFADGIHPHTDLSGVSTQRIADVLAEWLKQN